MNPKAYNNEEKTLTQQLSNHKNLESKSHLIDHEFIIPAFSALPTESNKTIQRLKNVYDRSMANIKFPSRKISQNRTDLLSSEVSNPSRKNSGKQQNFQF